MTQGTCQYSTHFPPPTCGLQSFQRGVTGRNSFPPPYQTRRSIFANFGYGWKQYAFVKDVRLSQVDPNISDRAKVVSLWDPTPILYHRGKGEERARKKHPGARFAVGVGRPSALSLSPIFLLFLFLVAPLPFPNPPKKTPSPSPLSLCTPFIGFACPSGLFIHSTKSTQASKQPSESKNKRARKRKQAASWRATSCRIVTVWRST